MHVDQTTPQPEEQPNTLVPDYVGTLQSMFGLGMKTGALTMATLGIYRFWAKTRVRRFVWSSVRIDGDPAEYTGTGMEKFLGFLVAIVILAVYLGVIQVLLSFAGFSIIATITDEATTEAEILTQLGVTYITFLAIFPLLLFAQYRSRRYMFSRTRWRGLRMGVSPGAWGYVWRGIVFYLIAGITFGLLTPLATYVLERYKIDRTWYGDAQFKLHGKWTGLYQAMQHVLIAFGFLALAILCGVLEIFGLAILLGVIGYFWLIFGWVFYYVHSTRYLASNTVLDGEVRFLSEPKTGTVLKHGLIAYFLASSVVSIGYSLLIFIGVIAVLEEMNIFQIVAAFIIGGGTFLAAMAMASAILLAFLYQPVLIHFLTTATIFNASHLETIRQRADDSIPDADGFADALDVGGGF